MTSNPLPEIVRYVVKAHRKLDSREAFQYLRETKDFLECITKREVLKVLYALHIIKASTSYELRLLLNVTSHTIIEHRLIKLMNAGLIEPMSAKHPDREKYYRSWNQLCPNTHNNVTLYALTVTAESIIDLLAESLPLLFEKSEALRVEARGKLFTEIFGRVSKAMATQEKDRLKSVVDVFGSCSRCQRIIRHLDFNQGKAELHSGKPYCASCVADLYRSGEFKLGGRRK